MSPQEIAALVAEAVSKALAQNGAAAPSPASPAYGPYVARNSAAPQGRMTKKEVLAARFGQPAPGLDWTEGGRPVVEIIPPADRPIKCPMQGCKGHLALKLNGKFGPFYGCDAHKTTGCEFIAGTRGPAKRHADALRAAQADAPAQVVDRACQKCGGRMAVRNVRGREFLGCERYRETGCDFTESMSVLAMLAQTVPAGLTVDNGPRTRRQSRKSA